MKNKLFAALFAAVLFSAVGLRVSAMDYSGYQGIGYSDQAAPQDYDTANIYQNQSQSQSQYPYQTQNQSDSPGRGISVYGVLPTRDSGSMGNESNDKNNLSGQGSTKLHSSGNEEVYIIQDGKDLWLVMGNIRAKLAVLVYTDPYYSNQTK